MIADNQTNTVYLSDILRKDIRFSETCSEISAILDTFNIPCKYPPNTNDIWARDYMPIQGNENRFIEYRYDPDYLQGAEKGFRDSKTYPDIVCDSINLKTLKSDILLDGGNIVKSNECVILTDKIFEENKKHYHKTQLIDKLKELFETDKIVILPWDKSEPYGHADGMIRFIDEGTVLINGYFKEYGKKYKNDFFGSLEQNGLDYKELTFNVPNVNEDLNWAYINFLQTKDLILIPKFCIDEDEQALDQIKSYYPDYNIQNRICQVNMSEIVKYGGALNCITWTIKE